MRAPYLVLLQAGFTVPETLPPPRWALTPPFHPYPQPLKVAGGLLSVALSLGSRRAGVTRRPVSMEPGLSSRIRDASSCPAAWSVPNIEIVDSLRQRQGLVIRLTG